MFLLTICSYPNFDVTKLFYDESNLGVKNSRHFHVRFCTEPISEFSMLHAGMMLMKGLDVIR